MREKIFAFIKSAFSEADGTGSSTRLLSSVTVLATLAWVTYIVARTTALPELGGAALVISAGFSGYAANKFSRRDDKTN